MSSWCCSINGRAGNGIYSLALSLLLLSWLPLQAEDDVILQAFYWDPPVDSVNLNGTWWDVLADQAEALAEAGFTAIWIPPPSKGAFGIYDMGYGVFDHYDLGNYDQKGSVETRFGSRDELIGMVHTMQANGIEVYVDIVLNHIFTSDDEEQNNPVVKQYVDNEAVVDGMQRTAYPTNQIKWKIPNAAAGDYFIKIKGYQLDYDADFKERAYDLLISWDATPEDTESVFWEFEPNNGNGEYNVFPGSGKHLWAHSNYFGDIDEFKITLTQAHDISIRIEARRENNQGQLVYANQENGYRVYEVWHNGQNLAQTTLQARTNTGVEYILHTGLGEPNYTWNYSHFHPADAHGYLGDSGYLDSVEPRWKLFGLDFNTFDPLVRQRLIEWGQWLTNTVGFDGYRIDFVRGIQEEFVAEWIAAMPRRADGSQRFVVSEYWTGHKFRLKEWVDKIASFDHGGVQAETTVFDFPLKSTLTDMANFNGADWNMAWLNHAGMVRDNGGNALPPSAVVTFVENHDTGKEHDQWLRRDWDMAYAYLLFAEGRPKVFYPQYFGITQIDQQDASITISPPASLRDDIDLMMFIRRNHLGGAMEVLSQHGNPWPPEAIFDVYVARRQGASTTSGAILVLNSDENQSRDLWVNHRSSNAFTDWSGQQLVNITSGNFEQTQVYADGRVKVWAPPRAYSVWVPLDEYASLTATK